MSSEEAELLARPRTYFYRGSLESNLDLSMSLSGDGTELHVAWGAQQHRRGRRRARPLYQPRARNATFVRFISFRGLDDTFGKPRTRTVLVEKPLLEGRAARAMLHSSSSTRTPHGAPPAVDGKGTRRD